jgi:hypothetical protein
MKLAIVLLSFVFSIYSWAYEPPAPTNELKAEQLSFTYMSTLGDIYADCVVSKAKQPHDFNVQCPAVKRNFVVHTLLYRYHRQVPEPETMFEFLFWVDEPENGYRSNTHSTWFYVSQLSDIKKIVSFVSIDDGVNQLRMQVNF